MFIDECLDEEEYSEWTYQELQTELEYLSSQIRHGVSEETEAEYREERSLILAAMKTKRDTALPANQTENYSLVDYLG